eukprot:GEMP01073285.1.p1 GENE.GEMP01073285.1~~GEMP01073285.1.p1  ORF type:complete len:316 (+),score=63.55 GEMP01073285.1:44-991(+)
MFLRLTIALYLCTALLIFVFFLRGHHNHKHTHVPISSVPVEGLHMRRYFFTILLLAVLLRVASLLLTVALRHDRSYKRQWFDYVALTFAPLPSLVFITAFSVILFFFIHIYFAARCRQQPLLKLVCIFANVLCYVVYVTICVITYLLQSWSKFRPFAHFFIGVVRIVEASSTLLFGSLIALVLHDRATKDSSRYRTSTFTGVLRLTPTLVYRTALITCALSITPLIFGVHEVLDSFDIATPTALQSSHHLRCLSELLPTIICMFGLTKEKITCWGNRRESEWLPWSNSSNAAVGWYEEFPASSDGKSDDSDPFLL